MVFILLTGCPSHQKKSEPAIVINEKAKSYEVTVPTSKLSLTIPKGDLKKPLSSMESYQYFAFEDRKVDFYIYGWFESGHRFSGMKENWESNIIRWKKAGLLKPQKVSFVKEGNWDVVTYELKRNGCMQSNLRAHFVRAGTWIELHLSFYCYASSGDRERLISFLKTISVQEKQ